MESALRTLQIYTLALTGKELSTTKLAEIVA